MKNELDFTPRDPEYWDPSYWELPNPPLEQELSDFGFVSTRTSTFKTRYGRWRVVKLYFPASTLRRCKMQSVRKLRIDWCPKTGCITLNTLAGLSRLTHSLEHGWATANITKFAREHAIPCPAKFPVTDLGDGEVWIQVLPVEKCPPRGFQKLEEEARTAAHKENVPLSWWIREAVKEKLDRRKRSRRTA